MHNIELKTGAGGGELATRALMLGGELKNVFFFFFREGKRTEMRSYASPLQIRALVYVTFFNN